MAELVAVGGRPLPLSAVGDAAGIASTDDVLALLSLRRFVRMGLRDGREIVEPIHDRIRETIVAQLSRAGTRSHHASLARAFEANSDTDPEVIATHLFGAGEDQRAATVCRASRASVPPPSSPSIRLPASMPAPATPPPTARRASD